MSLYSPSEKASLCKVILRATHALLAASLELCKSRPTASGDQPGFETSSKENSDSAQLDVRGQTGQQGARNTAEEGAAWACFIVEQTPMVSKGLTPYLHLPLSVSLRSSTTWPKSRPINGVSRSLLMCSPSDLIFDTPSKIPATP
jgi:hypothetical protein